MPSVSFCLWLCVNKINLLLLSHRRGNGGAIPAQMATSCTDCEQSARVSDKKQLYIMVLWLACGIALLLRDLACIVFLSLIYQIIPKPQKPNRTQPGA